MTEILYNTVISIQFMTSKLNGILQNVYVNFSVFRIVLFITIKLVYLGNKSICVIGFSFLTFKTFSVVIYTTKQKVYSVFI